VGRISEDDSSAARSQARRSLRLRSSSRSGASHRSDLKGSRSADTNSIPATRPKSNPSARARPRRCMRFGVKAAIVAPPSASLSCTRRRCSATNTRAHAQSSRPSGDLSAAKSSASNATRSILAIKRKAHAASSSLARSVRSSGKSNTCSGFAQPLNSDRPHEARRTPWPRLAQDARG